MRSSLVFALLFSLVCVSLSADVCCESYWTDCYFDWVKDENICKGRVVKQRQADCFFGFGRLECCHDVNPDTKEPCKCKDFGSTCYSHE